MAQSEEQNKTPETYLKEMQRNKLPDTEFK